MVMGLRVAMGRVVMDKSMDAAIPAFRWDSFLEDNQDPFGGHGWSWVTMGGHGWSWVVMGERCQN